MSRKVMVPDTLINSDPEDELELPSQQPRKHVHASRIPPSPGGCTTQTSFIEIISIEAGNLLHGNDAHLTRLDLVCLRV